MAPLILSEQNCPVSRLKRWICKITPMLSKNCGKEQKVSANGQFNHVLSSKDYTLSFFNSLQNVPSEWDDLAPKDNLFLQRPYLQLLEDFPQDCSINR